MKVRREIELYAAEEHKDALLWLLTEYHWASEFTFVASCRFVKYGTQSYQSHRVWFPTRAGQVLFDHMPRAVINK
jgi:hypothetical protein